MCAIEDCEPWAVCNETHPRARKEHPCTECGRLIQPGEQYMRIQGLCGGHWSTWAVCAHCDALSAWMSEMCGGYPLSMLHEELVEHWHEGYTSVQFGRLIVCMRLKWHDGTDPVPEGAGELAKSMLAQAVMA